MAGKTEFFKSLFEYAAGTIEIRCLPNRKQKFFQIDRKEELARFIEQNVEQNVYFAVSTRNGGGKKANIVHIPVCWVDIDDTSREKIDKKLRQSKADKDKKAKIKELKNKKAESVKKIKKASKNLKDKKTELKKTILVQYDCRNYR